MRSPTSQTAVKRHNSQLFWDGFWHLNLRPSDPGVPRNRKIKVSSSTYTRGQGATPRWLWVKPTFCGKKGYLRLLWMLWTSRVGMTTWTFRVFDASLWIVDVQKVPFNTYESIFQKLTSTSDLCWAAQWWSVGNPWWSVENAQGPCWRAVSGSQRQGVDQ